MTPGPADFLTWWTTTHQDARASERMWESWQAPHRRHILTALACLGRPIAGVYELGCGSGPNLRLLHSIAPTLRLGGCEPCEGMAAFASEHLGMTIDRDPLPAVPRKVEDVVLSCYTLAYLTPEDLHATLRGLRASGAQALIFLEPMGPGGLASHGDGSLPAWHHEYAMMCEETGWRLTWRWPLSPPVDGMNTVMIVEA